MNEKDRFEKMAVFDPTHLTALDMAKYLAAGNRLAFEDKTGQVQLFSMTSVDWHERDNNEMDRMVQMTSWLRNEVTVHEGYSGRAHILSAFSLFLLTLPRPVLIRPELLDYCPDTPICPFDLNVQIDPMPDSDDLDGFVRWIVGNALALRMTDLAAFFRKGGVLALRLRTTGTSLYYMSDSDLNDQRLTLATGENDGWLLKVQSRSIPDAFADVFQHVIFDTLETLDQETARNLLHQNYLDQPVGPAGPGIEYTYEALFADRL